MHAYCGSILFVDLSIGETRVEHPGDQFYLKYLGGYGLGARILYDRQRAGVDPLGPDNILGFATGPLTGTHAITGNRSTILAKSPKTGTWGDASWGGTFGQALKRAGFDAVFIRGIAPRWSVLRIEEGRALIESGEDLVGMDCPSAEDALKARLGKGFEVASIGPAGEQLSLMAGVVNDYSRVAARSAVGAVMGSKRLKALVVGGNNPPAIADPQKLRRLAIDRAKHSQKTNPFWNYFSKIGTCVGLASNTFKGDAPVKNWGGVGQRDFPSAAKISDVNILRFQNKKDGCWHCAIGCGGQLTVEEGPYSPSVTHKPEYESLAVFGPMILNDDVYSVIKANDLCNRLGMDTISAGATVAFAMECWEHGLLTAADTGGLDLSWGRGDTMVKLIEQMGHRTGFGALLTDGVKPAAQRIGRGAEQFAFHVLGEEVPAHDARFSPGLALTYQVDATPARHTQGGTGMFERFGPPPASLGAPAYDKNDYSGKGEAHRICADFIHIVNCTGLCFFGSMTTDPEMLRESLEAATGIPRSIPDLLQIGERIGTLRTLFNVREGVLPAQPVVPDRLVGKPPQTEGPNANVTVDIDAQRVAYFRALDWDEDTGMPSPEALRRLGLEGDAPHIAGR